MCQRGWAQSMVQSSPFLGDWSALRHIITTAGSEAPGLFPPKANHNIRQIHSEHSEDASTRQKPYTKNHRTRTRNLRRTHCKLFFHCSFYFRFASPDALKANVTRAFHFRISAPFESSMFHKQIDGLPFQRN